MSAFFGLTSEYKRELHEEVFALCYHGQGGFTWGEVYNMPIHLRRFYITKVKEKIDERNKLEQDEYNKAKRGNVPNFRRP